MRARAVRSARASKSVWHFFQIQIRISLKPSPFYQAYSAPKRHCFDRVSRDKHVMEQRLANGKLSRASLAVASSLLSFIANPPTTDSDYIEGFFLSPPMDLGRRRSVSSRSFLDSKISLILALLVLVSAIVSTDASIHVYDLNLFGEVGNAYLLPGGSEGIAASISPGDREVESRVHDGRSYIR